VQWAGLLNIELSWLQNAPVLLQCAQNQDRPEDTVTARAIGQSYEEPSVPAGVHAGGVALPDGRGLVLCQFLGRQEPGDPVPKIRIHARIPERAWGQRVQAQVLGGEVRCRADLVERRYLPNLTVSRYRKNANGITPASWQIATVLSPYLRRLQP